MGYLQGLSEYLDECYNLSVFQKALESKGFWELHLHEHRIIKVKVLENLTYDIKTVSEQNMKEEIAKVQIKCLYPAETSESVRQLIKTDKKVKALDLEPIFSPNHRYFVKNKSLFPLMKEKQVVYFTMLEGEIIRGIIAGFSRYDIIVNLKSGIPLTLLRHGIYDLHDKKGRCYLKSFQQERRDWEKSSLFIE
jgi:hypothetical protein